jgi:GNAT superfamily N-acetyltransferase
MGQPDTVSARLARREDSEQCAELCQKALEALQTQRGGPLYARRETGLLAKGLLRPGGLARLLDDPRRRMVIGTVDGTMVGFAVGRVDPVGEASIGVVDALYVEPESRASGVGHKVLESLVGWFKTSGCRAVDANALPGDRVTKNFFESEGFKARLLTMNRLID